MNLEKLKDPFPAPDIEWRIGTSGSGARGPWAMVLAYISARAVQDRLDAVVGPENWKVEYNILDKGVVCTLSIKVAGEWVAKQDVSEFTDIESFKGGVSGALKRAASIWGVGRYLYDLTENFARIVEKGTEGAKFAKTKDGTFYWVPPQLPDWALPESERGVKPKEYKRPPVEKATEVKEIVQHSGNSTTKIQIEVPKGVEVSLPIAESFTTPPVTIKPSGFKKVSKAPATQQGEGQW